METVSQIICFEIARDSLLEFSLLQEQLGSLRLSHPRLPDS